MSDSKVVFDFLTRGADRSARDFNKVGGAVDNTGDRLRRFSKVSTRTAKVIGTALGGALVAVTVGLGKAAKAAADEETEMAVLRNTLKKATKATDDQSDAAEAWITKMQNATGVADGDLRPALGKLAIATGNISDAQKLLAQALDISTARGKPLNTVVEALSKAAQGNVAGLQRLGIQTKDTAGKTLAFDQILKNANKTMGGAAAAAADTASGRYKILKARLQDLKETIGAKLLPALDGLLAFINDKLIPALGDLSGWFNEHVRPALQKLTNYINDSFLPALGKFADDVWPSVRDALASMKDDLDSLRHSFDRVRVSSDKTGTSFSVVGVLVKILAAVVKESFHQMTTYIHKFLDPVLALVELIQRLVDLISSIPDKLAGVKGAFNGIPDVIKKHIPKLPSIPGLADGGVVKARPGGTLALLAERGQDEAVVPLKHGRPAGGLGGDVTINQNIASTEPRRAADESARAVKRALWQANVSPA